MSSVLENHVDDILGMLIEGDTFKTIAERYKVSLSTLHEYMNKPEYSARTRNALEMSASSYADKAEQVLIDAEKDRIEMQRARELAQHYRWKAGKRNPKKYGDKLETDNKHSGKIEIVRSVKK
jgi:predicted RNA-binding protein with RPS1 domain